MIDQEAVAFYRDNGYLVVPGVLSRAEVASLREVTDDAADHRLGVDEHTR